MREITVLGEKKKKPIFPLIMYLFFSVLFLSSSLIDTYAPGPKMFGQIFMSRVLEGSQKLGTRFLAMFQALFLQNVWENRLAEAERENRGLLLQRNGLQYLIVENQKLRNLLQLQEKILERYVHAEIVSRSGDRLTGSFVINVGSREGILEDAPVIGYSEGKYGLIGKVHKVTSRRATVISLLNRYYRIGVTARLARTDYTGILIGDNRNYRMDFIDRQVNRQIQPGDLVLSVGGTIYPSNLPIGKVSRIEDLQYNPSLSLIIEPIVYLNQVEYISVLLRSTPSASPEN